MTKINKALDYNKLLNDQSQGKLLSKKLNFPLIAHIKYDGNYVVVEVGGANNTFLTSGGLTYTHTDDAGDIFNRVASGFYLAERIHGEGKLGARNKCNLRGSKDNQTSTGHSYKVFNYLPRDVYVEGKDCVDYLERRAGLLYKTGLVHDHIEEGAIILNAEELEAYRLEVSKLGYEGLMLYAYDFKWEHHKTRRTTNLVKYKKRPTADLLCIDVKEGTGKYKGLIGSLLLRDSEGREVYVGSGMSDEDRCRYANHYINKVIEIEYEQIVKTYIQATHSPLNKGVLIRHDKTKEEID